MTTKSFPFIRVRKGGKSWIVELVSEGYELREMARIKDGPLERRMIGPAAEGAAAFLRIGKPDAKIEVSGMTQAEFDLLYAAWPRLATEDAIFM